MKTKQQILEKIRKKIIVLDGGMGTELDTRGLPPGECPEAWGVKNREAVIAVHRAYLAAGARVIYTATLGGSPWKLGDYGETDVEGLNRDLARAARKAAGWTALVAGNIGSSGRFVEPFGELGFEEAVAGFKRQAMGLAAGGVDLFALETIFDIQEARAAVIAVREAFPDAFVIVTMTFQENGRTLGGTTPLAALITLQALGADAVGLNCGTGPAEALPFIASLKPYAKVPLVLKPNAGLPRFEDGRTVFPMGPEEFAGFARAFADAGVNLAGGCCGTTPDHIRLLARALAGRRPEPPRRSAPAALSSARAALVLAAGDPLRIIGERINPAGKETLQEALKAGDLSAVERLAREQKEQGADLLDVNAGVPGADEADLLRRIVALLSLKTDLPLVLDSADPEALIRALRLYPGRAVVNSVTGEREKLEKLAAAAALYGAMLIVLPVDGKEPPLTARERISIAAGIVPVLRRHGFTREDAVVDGLTLSLSSHPDLARETLKTIAYVHHRWRMRTVIGLSNVSFGLPRRHLLNAAFLCQAAAAGLTFAIANPGEAGLREARYAADLLRHSDPDAKRYLDFSGASAPSVEPAAPTEDDRTADPGPGSDLNRPCP